MRLGIDLGTTRTIVATCDRGNYPVVGFLSPDGDMVEHFPTISAERNGRLVHGLEAEQAARQGAPFLRSWKRLMSTSGPSDPVRIGSVELSLLELTTDFLSALGQALVADSNLPRPPKALPETVISVPANAHSSQRFITLEAFRRAGFDVRAMVNEPSAAGIEFAHRYRGQLNARRDHVVVYDLGGGTFDAALVLIAGDHHDVIDTAGIQRLGGDDFDEVLFEMALEAGGVKREAAMPFRDELLLECRTAKEALNPNSRRIVLDLSALGEGAPSEPVVVPVASYYDQVRWLVERTVESLREVTASGGTHSEVDDIKAQAAQAGVAGVYVVGGASGLPVVSRLLREHFGRRVHRSVYPAAATAIGLAIAADNDQQLPVTERFTRHLGVFREKESGERIAFDTIFPQGTPMPKPGGPPLIATRAYQPVHDVGHFRFVECAALTEDDEPRGDISPHGVIYFPFATQRRDEVLEQVPIGLLSGSGPHIEERYEVDAAGVVAVTIVDLDDGYAQKYVL
jgi:molecular chaperone DnaK (HSP70)